MPDANPSVERRGVDGWITTPVPDPETDGGYHVSNLEIERVFFESRNRYLAGLDVEDLWHQPVTPQIRELTTRFEAEIGAGTALDCATRIVSRSRRAFVMEQVLFDRGDGDVVATCRSVHVTVGDDGAVRIPDALWDAIERRNGGPILDTSATD